MAGVHDVRQLHRIAALLSADRHAARAAAVARDGVSAVITRAILYCAMCIEGDNDIVIGRVPPRDPLRKGTDMLNFNRRDQAADVKSPGKIPLKPAHYDAPESPARTTSGTVAKSMVTAPSLHDAVALTGTRVTTPAAAASAPV